jgi:signal transduction histidine kinase
MSKPWFIATMRGYGSMPNTWQGLLATAVYLASIFATLPALRWAFGRTITTAVASPVIMLLLTIGFMFFARIKTDKTRPPI